MNTLRLFIFIWLLCMNSQFIAAQSLFINEVMASNSSTITDEFGEYDDWIEIYNSGTTAIDLGGYYLSDNPLNPLLWQIPSTNAAQTTIPAGGFLVLWADKDPEQGAHHLDFKLAASGETLLLSSPFLTMIDQLTFGAQSPDVAYGSTLDGGNAFQLFYDATPNESNSTSGLDNTFEIIYSAQISTENDDAEEFGNGQVNLTSGDIEVGQDGATDQIVGFRFTNIDLPNGVEVTEAYLQLTTDEVSNNNCNVTIRAEASPNASAFQSLPDNLSNRTTTNNSVNWQPEAWNQVEEREEAQRSPNLNLVLNEVLGASDWASNNALALLIEGEGTRTAIAYDGEPESAAILTIKAEYPALNEPILPIKINEIAAHGSDLLDESGKAEDWIELYNPNNSPVFLGGLYVSDDADEPTKWRIAMPVTIQPNDFITIFADNDPEEGGLHTNFSLDNDGEEVVLTQIIGNTVITIDQVTFGEMAFKATYGCQTDGSSTYVRFGEPTPNASNNEALLFLDAPTFSLESGLYQSAQTLTLSHPLSDVDIYYTTNGDVPNNNQSTYSNALAINEHKSVRAIAYKNGYAPSPIANKAYTIGFEAVMPVLHITTDPDNFFSDETGIYVDGTNGTIDYCATTPVNWAQNWERPVNLQMILPDGTIAFDVNAGVKIAGACSRSNPVKSMNIFLREDIYGDKRINYPLFKERDHTDYQRLKLRNSGQDFFRMGFRDALNHKLLMDKIDIDVQASQSVVVFINGEFWALQNIRENYHGEYFDAIYGVKEKDIDIIKSPGLPWVDVKEGNDVAYAEFFQFLENSDFTNDADYQEFKDRVDWNEFLNYWITTTFMANYDWPANNLGIWRERKAGEKWRYMIQDTDGSTGNGLTSAAAADYNTLEIISNTTSTGWPNHKNSTLALRKMWENQEFRDEYIQRTCSIINLLYNDTRIAMHVDSVRAQYAPYVPAHIEKWGWDNAMGGSVFSWNGWVDKYQEFYSDRAAYFRSFMAQKFDLDTTYNLYVNFNENTGGKVVVNRNEMFLPFNYEGLYMQNVPVQLKAVADAGFVFSHWLETGETTMIIDFLASNDATITPIFTPIEENCADTQPDADSDGICDAEDNCPTTANTEQTDTDNDGVGDACDDCDENLIGTSCDDADICTINDVYDANCNCAGTFADEDSDGICDAEDNCPTTANTEQTDTDNDGVGDACDDCDENLIGTSCDDADICTINDVYDANCNCAGTFADEDSDGICDAEDNCLTTANTEQTDTDNDGVGDACDDCDENLIGTSCDDADICTINDVYDANCNCAGTFADEDSDGICDAEDNCPTTANTEQTDTDNDGAGDACDDCDENLIGTSCDDADICTINDVYDANCNCAGTFADEDSDGICADEDCDDNDSNLPQLPDTPCDDGNPLTINDVYLSDGCTCQGTVEIEGYCEAESDYPWHEHIGQVIFEDINNVSSTSQYTDFTAISTPALIDATHNITLYSDYSWDVFDNYWRVWIDYNHNFVFEANELVLDMANPAQVAGEESVPALGTITVPADALEGLTRMRIIFSRDAEAEPCAVTPFGEVEDYTLDLVEDGTNSYERLFLNPIKLFPNPSRNNLTITMDDALSNNTQITVYNALGMKVLQQKGMAIQTTISVENWASGIYWLTITQASGKSWTRNFLVE